MKKLTAFLTKKPHCLTISLYDSRGKFDEFEAESKGEAVRYLQHMEARGFTIKAADVSALLV